MAIRLWAVLVVLVASVLCARPGIAAPIICSAAGVDAAAVQPAVDLYRADVGARREISWDVPRD